MKKTAKIVILMLIFLVLLFPFPMQLKDGGSIYYAPLTHIYEVRVYRAMTVDENGTEGWKKGTELYLFGQVVHSNTYFSTEK